MPDDSQRVQLAGLVSTGSRGYSASTPRNVAGLARRDANVRSDGSVHRIAIRRVCDRS
jgi:hypothetical protein